MVAHLPHPPVAVDEKQCLPPVSNHDMCCLAVACRPISWDGPTSSAASPAAAPKASRMPIVSQKCQAICGLLGEKGLTPQTAGRCMGGGGMTMSQCEIAMWDLPTPVVPGFRRTRGRSERLAGSRGFRIINKAVLNSWCRPLGL